MIIIGLGGIIGIGLGGERFLSCLSSCLEARPYKIGDRSGPADKLFKGRMHRVGSAE